MKKLLINHPGVIAGVLLCVFIYVKFKTTRVAAKPPQASVIILITNGVGNQIAIQLPMDVWITTNSAVKQHADGRTELEINQ